jgi:hypothetical protein
LRILLFSSDPQTMPMVQRSFAGSFEFRTAISLRDVLRIIRQAEWLPEVILADLDSSDAESQPTLDHLREIAGSTPVMVRNGCSLEELHQQLDLLSRVRETSGADSLMLMQLALHQQQMVQRTIAMHRAQILAELDRIAGIAAESAVSRGIEQLLVRLGLDDPEGVRVAVRLGRAWEAAKSKFFSGIATGIASAFLLALGAGVMALLKNNNSK